MDEQCPSEVVRSLHLVSHCSWMWGSHRSGLADLQKSIDHRASQQLIPGGQDGPLGYHRQLPGVSLDNGEHTHNTHTHTHPPTHVGTQPHSP